MNRPYVLYCLSLSLCMCLGSLSRTIYAQCAVTNLSIVTSINQLKEKFPEAVEDMQSEVDEVVRVWNQQLLGLSQNQSSEDFISKLAVEMHKNRQYWPGLNPSFKVRNIEDLKNDFVRNQKKPGESMLHNIWGNVYIPNEIHELRVLSIRKKKNQENFKKYLENQTNQMIEKRILSFHIGRYYLSLIQEHNLGKQGPYIQIRENLLKESPGIRCLE